jgi:hypothetical protein
LWSPRLPWAASGISGWERVAYSSAPDCAPAGAACCGRSWG